MPREVQFIKELLLIKFCKLRVDFYDDETNYLENRFLTTRDVIL